MTIRVSGQAKLAVDYVVELDMTEEEFYALDQSKQDELILHHTDWHRVSRRAEVEIDDHLDVVNVVE